MDCLFRVQALKLGACGLASTARATSSTNLGIRIQRLVGLSKASPWKRPGFSPGCALSRLNRLAGVHREIATPRRSARHATSSIISADSAAEPPVGRQGRSAEHQKALVFICSPVTGSENCCASCKRAFREWRAADQPGRFTHGRGWLSAPRERGNCPFSRPPAAALRGSVLILSLWASPAPFAVPSLYVEDQRPAQSTWVSDIE